MGVVYRARQDALDRTVAIKVVAEHLSADPEFRARFEREARAAGALNHPHIVAVHDAGEDAGRLYLTMQYVEGHDLSTMLRRHGPMPAADAVEIIEQIGSALDAAHAHRLVHRDVKPANVMVTRKGPRWHAYLTDFGITTQLGEAGLTQTGTAIGTLDYMAPEQLVGDPYDHRADVYALGAVLFQALTGRVPFPRDTDAARIYAHLHAEVPAVSEMRPDAHPAEVFQALSTVVRRAMAKQPDERPGSAGELAAAARTALEGRTTGRAPRASAYVPEGSAPNRRLGRRALLLGGVGALALGGAAAYAIPRLGEDGPGEDSATNPTATALGLPDSVPPARVSTELDKPFDVGKRTRATALGDTVLWVGSRSEEIMTRVDLISGTQESVGVGGVPHDCTALGESVWVLVVTDYDTFLQEMDGTSGALQSRIDLPDLSYYGLEVGKDDQLWVVAEDSLLAVDRKAGKVGETVEIGEPAKLSYLDDEVMYLVTRDKSKLMRRDPKTGQEVAKPQPFLKGAVDVAVVEGEVFAGGVDVGWGPITNGTMPAKDEMRLKGFYLSIGENGPVWGMDLSTSEMRRVKPDLSGTIGAAVPGVDVTVDVYAVTVGQHVAVLDGAAGTARIYSVTPLRRT